MDFPYRTFTPIKKIKGVVEFDNVLEGWDVLVGRVHRDKNIFVLISILELVTIIILVLSSIHLAHLPKNIPMVITVDNYGKADYVGDISKYTLGDLNIQENSFKYYLELFVKNISSQSSDFVIREKNWGNAFEYITKKGYKLLEEEYFTKDPLNINNTLRIYTEIISNIKITDKTYSIEWTETIYKPNGGMSSIKNMVGMFSIVIENNNKKNPLGIYVDEYYYEEKLNEK